jgi:TPR repeat protein
MLERYIGRGAFALCLIGLLAVVPAINPASADDYERGLSAYNRAEYTSAFEQWQNLAVLGHPNAQFGLGMMYSLGQGVPRDHEAAAAWLHLAAVQGHRGAQLLVGHSYEQGHGVAQNYAAAHRWYMAAADQGEAKAQNNLGRMYEKGFGVAADRDLAIYWYEEATRNGNRNARANLVRLLQAREE